MLAAALIGIAIATWLLLRTLWTSTFTRPCCCADAAGEAASPTASMAVVTNAQMRTLVLRITASMASSLTSAPYPWPPRLAGHSGLRGAPPTADAVAHSGRSATRGPAISSDGPMAGGAMGRFGKRRVMCHRSDAELASLAACPDHAPMGFGAASRGPWRRGLSQL